MLSKLMVFVVSVWQKAKKVNNENIKDKINFIEIQKVKELEIG